MFHCTFCKNCIKNRYKNVFIQLKYQFLERASQGAYIPHVQIKESKKLDTKPIMETQFPSHSSLPVSPLCVCALCMLCAEGDPTAFQKMGLFRVLGTEQLSCICRANGGQSRATESEQGWLCVEGWARALAHTNRWACFLILSLSVCLFATADCSAA